MFWASLTLSLAACTVPVAAGPQPVAWQVQAERAAPGQTRLVLVQGAAAPLQLLVERDAQVPPRAQADSVEIVARIEDRVLVIVETYPSRLNQGQGACGAGEERILRVLRVSPPPAAQTYRTKLASCWKSLEPDPEFGTQGLRWTAPTQELRIEWFRGPGDGKPASRTLRIQPDGTVTVVKPA